MAHYSKKLQAIKLRKEGRSYKEINQIVKVSKSTLSRWLKDIGLTLEQRSRLTRLQATAYLGSKKKQAKSLEYHEEIMKEAEKEANRLYRDTFFTAGLMLYWAEGNKNFGSVQFCNSDPSMIKLMMRWFRKFCNVPEEKFRIGLILHSAHQKDESKAFWQEVTSIPLTQFHRPYIKETNFNHRKKETYEGTCKIIIHSRDLLSKIIGWKNGIERVFLSNNPIFD